MQTLKVFTSGRAMVTDHKALSSGVRRYIGRQYDPTLGKAGGWVPNEEPQEIENSADYRQAVREGDLLPADQETASLCGVSFQSK